MILQSDMRTITEQSFRSAKVIGISSRVCHEIIALELFYAKIHRESLSYQLMKSEKINQFLDCQFSSHLFYTDRHFTHILRPISNEIILGLSFFINIFLVEKVISRRTFIVIFVIISDNYL